MTSAYFILITCLRRAKLKKKKSNSTSRAYNVTVMRPPPAPSTSPAGSGKVFSDGTNQPRKPGPLNCKKKKGSNDHVVVFANTSFCEHYDKEALTVPRMSKASQLKYLKNCNVIVFYFETALRQQIFIF